MDFSHVFLHVFSEPHAETSAPKAPRRKLRTERFMPKVHAERFTPKGSRRKVHAKRFTLKGSRCGIFRKDSTYVSTHVRTYVRTFVRTYVRTSIAKIFDIFSEVFRCFRARSNFFYVFGYIRIHSDLFRCFRPKIPTKSIFFIAISLSKFTKLFGDFLDFFLISGRF